MNEFLSVPGVGSVVGPIPQVQSAQVPPVPLQSNPVFPTNTPNTVLTSMEVPADPLAGRFASLNEVPYEELLSGETREFKGDGTSFLVVPGLTRLAAIRIGNQLLPLYEPRTYPTNATLTSFQTINEPLVKIDRNSTGDPVIIRSVISNNGRWPADTKIFVTGEWEDETQRQNSSATPASVSSQAAATEQQNDALTRQQVYQDTHDPRIATVEGNAPTIVDPIAAVHGSSVPPTPPVSPVPTSFVEAGDETEVETTGDNTETETAKTAKVETAEIEREQVTAARRRRQ